MHGSCPLARTAFSCTGVEPPQGCRRMDPSWTPAPQDPRAALVAPPILFSHDRCTRCSCRSLRSTARPPCWRSCCSTRSPCRSRRQRPEFGAATPAAPAARRSMRPPCRAAVFSDSLDAVADQRCRPAAQPAIGAATEDAPSHSAAVARPHRRSYTRLIRRGRVVSSCIRLIRADMRPYQEVADASGIHGCAA